MNFQSMEQEKSIPVGIMLSEKRAKLYEGALIKESIEDETLLDYIRVHKVELWNTGGVPKYWTVIFLHPAFQISRN